MKQMLLRLSVLLLLVAAVLTLTPSAAKSPLQLYALSPTVQESLPQKAYANGSLETSVAYPADRYFYSQLDEEIRFLYDALNNASNLDKLKQGLPITVGSPYTIYIPSHPTQDEYNALFDTFKAENLRLNALLDQLPNAAAAFDRDRSDIFWVNGVSGAVSIYENGNAVNGGVTLSVGNTYSLALEITLPLSPDWDGKDATDRVLQDDIDRLETAVSALAEQALAVSSTRYEQLLYVNDQLCKYNAYHTQAADENYALRYPWTPISALDQLTDENDQNGSLKPVCEGYARAFKLVCDRLQIPCVLVSGIGNQEKHMWNYVQMENGYWYAVDVTWNDNTLSNRYFLVGKDTMKKSHTVTNQIMTSGQSQSFLSPTLSQNAYQYQTLMLTASSLSPMGTDSVTLTASGIPNGKNATLSCLDTDVVIEKAGEHTWTVRFPNQTASYVFNLTVQGYHQSAKCAIQVTHQHLNLSLEQNSDTHHKQICDVCGEGELIAHQYPDPPKRSEASCTEAGELVKECPCGYQLKQILPPTGHAYDDDLDTDCNTCGEKKDAETAPNGNTISPLGGTDILTPLLGGCFSSVSATALPLTVLLALLIQKKRKR